MVADWLRSIGHMRRKDVKVVAYLSAEFLMGPHLANNLVNLGLLERFRQAVADLGRTWTS
jgi:starch phosphorylase